MKLVFDHHNVQLWLGRAEEYLEQEPIDLVLTNPYGPLPAWMHRRGIPMLVHQWVHRQAELEAWLGPQGPLQLVSLWNAGREAFWAVNMPTGAVAGAPVDLRDLRPEPGGWYPPELVQRLLALYGQSGQTLWDGFMGRGTVGREAGAIGMRYIGVEELPHHLQLAKEYLSL